MKHHLAIPLIVASALLMPAPSAPAQSISGPRKVNYVLTDNAYSPKTMLKVRKGETITFTFTNRGKVLHEALIATPTAQQAHEKEMAGMGARAMADEKDRVSVKPGTSKKLTIKFDRAGKLEIACHQPNHYKLGMRVPVTVS